MNLSQEDKAILDQFARARGAKQLRCVKLAKDRQNDWRAYLVEGLYTIRQNDPIGRKIKEFDSNRYCTIEIKPKRLGGGAVVHEVKSSTESRRHAESAYEHIEHQIAKFEREGHL